MAAELRDKLDKLQVSLLCDDNQGSIVASLDAIEGVVNSLEKELSPYVYLVGHQEIAPKRFNTAIREWENILGVAFNAGTDYAAAKALSNGHIAVIRNDCRYVEVDPMNRRDYRQLEYFGK